MRMTQLVKGVVTCKDIMSGRLLPDVGVGSSRKGNRQLHFVKFNWV